MNLEVGQDQKRCEQDVSDGPFDQRTNGFYGKHEKRFMLKERHEKEMNKNLGMKLGRYQHQTISAGWKSPG